MQPHTSVTWTRLWEKVLRSKSNEQFLLFCNSQKLGLGLLAQLDAAERKDSRTRSSTAFGMTVSRSWRSCIYLVDPITGQSD